MPPGFPFSRAFRAALLPSLVCFPSFVVCRFSSTDLQSHLLRSAVSQLSLLSPSAVSSLPIRCLISCGLQSHSSPSSSSLLFLLSRSAVSSLAVCSRTAVPHLPVCCFFSPDMLSHLLRSPVALLSRLFPFAVPSSSRCGLSLFDQPLQSILQVAFLVPCGMRSPHALECPLQQSPLPWCPNRLSRHPSGYRALSFRSPLTASIPVGYRPAFLPVISCSIGFRSSRSATTSEE